ncbi:MAG TPA: phosphotransferase [Gammaproteobacteria bacterium]|nr:phosphotransferase [Gammaproteobacteria bacterium]
MIKSLTMNPIFEQWLTQQCGLTSYQLDPLAGDASFRRYFRVRQANRSFIAMDASSEKSSCVPFAAIARSLRKYGLNTPEIFAEDFDHGFLLLTDFGDRLYLKELTLTNADMHYSHALDALQIMQHCKIENWTLKSFTADFMRNELMLFKEWFLEKHLGLILNDSMHDMLTNCFNFLADSAASQPQVFMHRDYHSANLMVLPQNQVGILDFQDAFLGPVTYDLVSLLRDCYISWPNDIVQKWVLYFWERMPLPRICEKDFLRWFDLMSMQRHLKALLTFSRKYRRDQNAHYLQHIPRTLNYILATSAIYPETSALNQFLKNMVMKKCVE